jgi:hypothetical protein
MPTKSPDDRIRRALASGTTATIKASDPGVRTPGGVRPEAGLSPHALKKSRWNVGEGTPEGRSVRRASPPHAGSMKSPPVEGEAESVLPADPRAALPREEREAERIRMGHRDRLSPGKKKRGQY